MRYLILLVASLSIVLATTRVEASPLAPGDVLVVAELLGTVHHYSSSGDDLGLFAGGLNGPAWITMDAGGNVWVVEYFGWRVDKFSSSGVQLLSIATSFQPGDVRVGDDGTIYVGNYFGGGIYAYAPTGAPLGLFAASLPVDFMELDAAGNLYVDNSQGIVQRFSPTGGYLGEFAHHPAAAGLAFDGSGNLYVASFSPDWLIEKYSPTGTDLGLFAAMPLTMGIDFDSAGNLYTASGVVGRFSSTGLDLGSFDSEGAPLAGARDIVVVPGSLTAVPEPSTIVLLGFGLVGIWRRLVG